MQTREASTRASQPSLRRSEAPVGVAARNLAGGGVSDTSNDAAIVYMPCGAPVTMAIFWKGLGSGAKARAGAAIADIARVLYEHLGEPA